MAPENLGSRFWSQWGSMDVNIHSVVHLRLEGLTMYTFYLSKCMNMHLMPQNDSQQITFVLSDSSEKREVKSNAKS